MDKTYRIIVDSIKALKFYRTIQNKCHVKINHFYILVYNLVANFTSKLQNTKINNVQKERIYLDNAASTPLLTEVYDIIVEDLKAHYGNPSAIHAQGRKSRTIIEKARKKIANHLHCSISEIFFTSGATEANNTILTGAVCDLGVDHIIYSQIEHPSVLNSIKSIEKKYHISTDTIQVDQQGNIDLEDLKEKIKIGKKANKKILVSVMYVNNEIGTILDLKSIGNICTENNILLHSDAVQAIGKIPIDLSTLPIHFLSASSHKFHGPKGIGFFYMNSDHIFQPMIHGGSQERNMRSGTENTAYIDGTAMALSIAENEMGERSKYVNGLKEKLVNGLQKNIPGVEVLGNPIGETQQYSICNISFPPHPKNEMLMMNLDIAGISASGGSACSSGIEYVSHVLEAIKIDIDRSAIRFSLSHFNTEKEIESVIKIITKIMS